MMDDSDGKIQFNEIGIDDCLLQAISKLNWVAPTLVQQKAIPLVLAGKDILLRAHTGSGKTAVYAIPIIHQIIQMKKRTRNEQSHVHSLSAVILLPSRDLSQQATLMIKQLSRFGQNDVRCLDVSSENPDLLQVKLAMEPDIVVGTPSRLLLCLNSGYINLKHSLKWLVFDEADLLHTYGYEKDINALMEQVTNSYQALLLSATLTEDVEKLKRLVLRDQVTLDLSKESDVLKKALVQYYINYDSIIDKFVIITALFKLKVIKGTTLIFVNSIPTCYRLKLIFQRFDISCCVLNSELPANTRVKTVQEFNQGMYQHVIATDESSMALFETSDNVDESRKEAKDQPRTASERRKVKNYSSSRGVDFHSLNNVINFDLPDTVEAYIHRVGRTARCGEKGVALSLVNSGENETDVLSLIQSRLSCEAGMDSLKPYEMDVEELAGFRYRCQDALLHAGPAAIKRERLAELRKAIVKSNKLQEYFRENPVDLIMLKQNNRTKKPEPLSGVPEYLVPTKLNCIASAVTKETAPKVQKAKKRHRPQEGSTSKRKTTKRKTNNPLRSFKYK